MEQPLTAESMNPEVMAPDKTESAGIAVPSMTHEVPAAAHVAALPLYQNQSNPKPVYPKLARRRNWQGTVLLDELVSENAVLTRYVSTGVAAMRSSTPQLYEQ